MDGRGVQLIVSGAFSISWQMRFCKVRNTRLTLALCYQTQIRTPLWAGECSSSRGLRRVQGKTFWGLDSLKFPSSRGFHKGLIHFKIRLFLVHVIVTEHPEPKEGWRLKWRDVCQESRKRSLKSVIDVFSLWFLTTLFLATYHTVLLFTFVSLFPMRLWNSWGLLFILLATLLGT